MVYISVLPNCQESKSLSLEKVLCPGTQTNSQKHAVGVRELKKGVLGFSGCRDMLSQYRKSNLVNRNSNNHHKVKIVGIIIE